MSGRVTGREKEKRDGNERLEDERGERWVVMGGARVTGRKK